MPKKNLEKLEETLGVDLQGDADITVELGSGKKRELRIRSLGSAAYHIWSVDFALDRKPIEDLSALEEVTGVKLDAGTEVDISTSASAEPLRIRSLGSRFYDIWSAT
ncbi:MAG: hypothetical protein LGR52_03365 [Candidatus Thiosymbion ectosymbiont of Robbea hypermnestra]|nr:hypothetical protein [Candidatus Thiosymbion ectosymbiont of Robbea hypermnestra]